MRAGCRLDEGWTRVGPRLYEGCTRVGLGLDAGWMRVGRRLDEGWTRAIRCLMDRPSVDTTRSSLPSLPHLFIYLSSVSDF